MVEVKRNHSRDLTVSEVAARSGVSVAAIHFYERKGLITSVRTKGNQRRFPRAVLRRVALVQVAREIGIPLAELAAIFNALPDARTPNRRDWQKIASRWQVDIKRRISLLLSLQRNLTGCLGCGCLSLERCSLLNKNDHLSARGNGPLRLL
jgi:MerR family transcriptional regulator, redox-sensitive transcriptional activator SoxR